MYTSVEQADAYVNVHYTSSSAHRKRWTQLSDEDKTIYLTNAFESIESLNFRGRKAVFTQNTAFPRLPYQYGKVDEIAPERVKSAEIELALWLSDEEHQEHSEKRSQLIADGVKSFSIGDLSENYGDISTSETFSALDCKKCKELLKPYLSGGFDIC